jgi:hypothetical protein
MRSIQKTLPLAGFFYWKEKNQTKTASVEAVSMSSEKD